MEKRQPSSRASLADRLIAHRGWPARYAENSLAGIRAVLEAGATRVEFDVQLTADLQPVVLHDDRLERLSGRPDRISDLRLDQLDEIRIAGPGDDHQPIARLDEILATFGHHPAATAFVELKRGSIRRFGRARCVEIVMAKLLEAPCPCVFLSFDSRAVSMARARGAEATGWVFRPWSILARWRAKTLKPDYLFVRADRVPAGPAPFWPGAWQWVIYGVADRPTASNLIERGAALIEVDDLPSFNDPAASRTGRDHAG